MLFHLSSSASNSALRLSRVLTWSNFLWRESRAARVLRARFKATLSLGSTVIGGRGPFRRRGLVTDALVAGEPLVDDFLRCAVSKTTGEFVLEGLDRAIELVLIVRSSAGAEGGEGFSSAFSGNSENQASGATTASPWNMGDVS